MDNDEVGEYFHMHTPPANVPASRLLSESSPTSPSINSNYTNTNNPSTHNPNANNNSLYVNHQTNITSNPASNSSYSPKRLDSINHQHHSRQQNQSPNQNNQHIVPLRKKQLSGYQAFPQQPSPQPMYQHQQPHHRSSHAIDAKNSAVSGFGFFGYMLICLSYILVFLTFPISICCCIKIVKEYERAVIFRLGMFFFHD